MSTRLRFVHDPVLKEWRSENGDYVVWIQARLHNGELEWGARVVSLNYWITDTAGSRQEAMNECREFEKRR